RRRSAGEGRNVIVRSGCLTVGLVPLKSKRVASSRWVWSTALRTSWRSTSDTTSNDGMKPKLPGHYTDRLLGRCPSGQREQTVNLPAYAYVGSNPARPTR